MHSSLEPLLDAAALFTPARSANIASMARTTHPREDLLKEATALVRRVQLKLHTDQSPGELFCGARAQGGWSIYFDTDPVYHFNSANELRRAFVDDRLIKAKKGKLIAMCRQRTDEAVEMLSEELTAQEQLRFCSSLMERLGIVRDALSRNLYTVVGQISTVEDDSNVDGDVDVLGQFQAWLTAFQEPTIAQSPQAK